MCHPLVVVRKPSGNLRVCLDPKALNKVICKEFFEMPTVEDLWAELTDAKVFSILDANTGFYQIALDEESSKLVHFLNPIW